MDQLIDPVEILYKDSSLLVVIKPVGLASQPDKTGQPDLLTIIRNQLKSEVGDLLPVHRLDRPVSGLLTIARTPAAQTSLTRQMNEKSMHKSYLAVSCGVPVPDEGHLTDYLIKNERLNISQIVKAKHPGAKIAKLSYKVLEKVCFEDQPLALLNVQLETGRHHQIRVQTANAGWPLWGDSKYNQAFRRIGGWHQIALVAAELKFSHPETGELLTFSLPLPKHHPFSLFNVKIM